MHRTVGLVIVVLLLAAACGDDAIATTTTTTAATTTTTVINTDTEVTIDQLLALCPSAAQMTMLQDDFDVVFLEPPSGDLVCTSAAGSADLTRVQERVYQSLLVTTELKFDAPFPWTDLTLYAWLKESITGIRVSSEFTTPGLDAVPGYIDLPATGLSAYLTLRWVDPQMGTGMDGLVGLIVAYAGYMTATEPECVGGEPNGVGAAGYFFMTWLADHSDPDFLTADDIGPSYYRDAARDAAEQARPPGCG